MISLDDKVVVVTGASSGIGKATSLEFARKGARVVLAARRLTELQSICEEIHNMGGQCIAVKTDVTSCTEVEALFRETVRRFGQVDILVNNAGRGLKREMIETDSKDWQSVIDTNLKSVFLCSKEAAIAMAQKKIQGHIITVASIAGLFAVPGYASYCASKYGVRGFQRAVKWELRRLGIRTSTIYPFRVDTAFFNIYPSRPPRWQMLHPKDLAQYITAIATGSRTFRLYARLVLIFKRLYYLISFKS